MMRLTDVISGAVLARNFTRRSTDINVVSNSFE
jgi:hypothetical protein